MTRVACRKVCIRSETALASFGTLVASSNLGNFVRALSFSVNRPSREADCELLHSELSAIFTRMPQLTSYNNPYGLGLDPAGLLTLGVAAGATLTEMHLRLESGAEYEIPAFPVLRKLSCGIFFGARFVVAATSSDQLPMLEELHVMGPGCATLFNFLSDERCAGLRRPYAVLTTRRDSRLPCLRALFVGEEYTYPVPEAFYAAHGGKLTTWSASGADHNLGALLSSCPNLRSVKLCSAAVSLPLFRLSSARLIELTGAPRRGYSRSQDAPRGAGGTVLPADRVHVRWTCFLWSGLRRETDAAQKAKPLREQGRDGAVVRVRGRA